MRHHDHAIAKCMVSKVESRLHTSNNISATHPDTSTMPVTTCWLSQHTHPIRFMLHLHVYIEKPSSFGSHPGPNNLTEWFLCNCRLISSCFQSQTLWSYTPASVHIQVLEQLPPLHLVMFSLSQQMHVLCLGSFKPAVSLLLCMQLSQLPPVMCSAMSATIRYSHVSLVTTSPLP